MNKDNNSNNQITRKEALKKMGRFAAITAVGTFFILSPKQAHAQSPPDPGEVEEARSRPPKPPAGGETWR